MRNILLLLVLLVAGTWWMRHNERKRHTERDERNERMRQPPASDPRKTVRDALPPAERMVQCTECNTFLPESEALGGAHGKHFCSTAHRDAYLTREHRV